MISTKNIVCNISDVPSYWVFKYYLNIEEELTGQRIRMKSVWNPYDDNPSMFIYVDKVRREYYFKDFSTGKYGSKVNIVQELFNLSYSDAILKIIDDYNSTPVSGLKELKTPEAWGIDTYTVREWNKLDSDFWLPFSIGKTMLETYNVRPLESYSIKKLDQNIKINNSNIYGYFTKDGEIYRIYMPYSKFKFYIVKDHLQGFDQLEYKSSNLVICSSLKDAMCLKGFGYDLEVIAPNSENSIIKPHLIEYFKNKFNCVITLFDNDAAGSKAIDTYKTIYNIDGCQLPICKDISDSVKEHGRETIHKHLKPLLRELIYKT